MSCDKANENGVSKLGKLPPKLLEGVDNVENIWKTMRERFPQTASILCDMEATMKRVEDALRYREMDTQNSMSDTESECFSKLESPDNDFESLNEWSQVVNDSFPEDSDIISSPHTSEVPNTEILNNKSDELAELDKLSIIQGFDVPQEIYNETITTISSMKLMENSVPVVRPSITTKEAVLAPVQPRIFSSEDKLEKNDNDSTSVYQRNRTSNGSPLRSASEADKPSLIPVRSPRLVSPRTKSTTPKISRSPPKCRRQKSPPLFNNFASNHSCNRLIQKSTKTTF